MRHLDGRLPQVTLSQINPDGHCLFSAIADQLALHGLIPSAQASYGSVRHAAANYIQDHVDDFLPFLPSEFGEDGDGAADTGLMSPKAFAGYCERIRNTGQWGGEPEILALSRAYNVPIFVVQSGTPTVVVHTPTGATVDWRDKNIKALWISYHRRMYGLGEVRRIAFSTRLSLTDKHSTTTRYVRKPACSRRSLRHCTNERRNPHTLMVNDRW